jgi:hypothetical protein
MAGWRDGESSWVRAACLQRALQSGEKHEVIYSIGPLPGARGGVSCLSGSQALLYTLFFRSADSTMSSELRWLLGIPSL